VMFGDTFIKTGKSCEFSAVVDLEMLKNQQILFVVLKVWRRKTAFFAKILFSCARKLEIKIFQMSPYRASHEKNSPF